MEHYVQFWQWNMLGLPPDLERNRIKAQLITHGITTKQKVGQLQPEIRETLISNILSIHGR